MKIEAPGVCLLSSQSPAARKVPQAPALCSRPVSLPKCHLMKGHAGLLSVCVVWESCHWAELPREAGPLALSPVQGKHGDATAPRETFPCSFWEAVYYFSVSAITNDHSADGCKQQKFFSLIVPDGRSLKLRQGHPTSESFQGESFLACF